MFLIPSRRNVEINSVLTLTCRKKQTALEISQTKKVFLNDNAVANTIIYILMLILICFLISKYQYVSVSVWYLWCNRRLFYEQFYLKYM